MKELSRGWINKGIVSPLETQPVEGLFFLDGDLVAGLHPGANTEGYKFPTIVFPSGVQCDLWESDDPDNPIVHIFGAVDLPLFGTRDEAYSQMLALGEALDYLVRINGDKALEIFSGGDEPSLRLFYNYQERRLDNVLLIDVQELSVVPNPSLLDEQLRQALPRLTSTQHLGLNAQALAKYVAPYQARAWYPTEFDGEDQFFGLIVDTDMRLGYFSLMELFGVSSLRELPIERDPAFTPTSLYELRQRYIQAWAERDRPPVPRFQPPAADKRRPTDDVHEQGIVERFAQLSDTAQWAVCLHLISEVAASEQGPAFLAQIRHRYFYDRMLPELSAEDLRDCGLSREEIAAFDEYDYEELERRIVAQYVDNLYSNHLEEQVERMWQEKQEEERDQADAPDGYDPGFLPPSDEPSST